MEIRDDVWIGLTEAAWDVRGRARVLGPNRTEVGAAVLTDTGETVVGCNVEHRLRSHDIHAETNALSNMVVRCPEATAVGLVVAARRERFTPCGACLDWIFELGASDCLVAFSPEPGRWNPPIRLGDLMPYYPS